MNQLAGVFADLKLVRALKPSEYKRLGKEEQRNSYSNLAPFRQQWNKEHPERLAAEDKAQARATRRQDQTPSQPRRTLQSSARTRNCRLERAGTAGRRDLPSSRYGKPHAAADGAQRREREWRGALVGRRAHQWLRAERRTTAGGHRQIGPKGSKTPDSNRRAIVSTSPAEANLGPRSRSTSDRSCLCPFAAPSATMIQST